MSYGIHTQGGESIDLHLNRAFGLFLVCTRLSSLVKAHRWLLVYKPKKALVFFPCGTSYFSKKLFFANTYIVGRP